MDTLQAWLAAQVQADVSGFGVAREHLVPLVRDLAASLADLAGALAS